jgi:hypothetical protein
MNTGVSAIIKAKASTSQRKSGISNKGNELLRCYQISGGHSSEKPHEWELLTVSKISALANTGTRFSGPRPDYKRGDKAMATPFPTTWHPKQELSGLRSYAHLLFSR